MKKILFLLAITFSVITIAQAPQGISYQAIALDGSGNPLVNTTIGLQLSILDNSATGTSLYTETHTKTTNAQGLYNLVIGQGTPTLGTFSTIKWETNSKFLSVSMDSTGGTTFVLVGTTQLLSVPYALYAGKVNADNVVGGADVINVSSSIVNTNSFITDTNAYVYFPSLASQSIYSWQSIPIAGIPFMKSMTSFLTSTNAYIFTNTWNSYPIAGLPHKIIMDGNLALIVTSSNAYLFKSTNPPSNINDWLQINISGNIIDSSINLMSSSSAVLTSTNFYVYSKNSSGTAFNWISIPITGTPLKIKYTFGGIMALTSTNAYIYGLDNYDPNISNPTYSWHNIPISGTIKID